MAALIQGLRGRVPHNQQHTTKAVKRLKQYQCDECEYAATKVSNLKRHKESKHEGIRYTCDQCEYVTTGSSHLKQHIKSKHEGIRYPCDQCGYAATQLRYLKKHKESKH